MTDDNLTPSPRLREIVDSIVQGMIECEATLGDELCVEDFTYLPYAIEQALLSETQRARDEAIKRCCRRLDAYAKKESTRPAIGFVGSYIWDARSVLVSLLSPKGSEKKDDRK